MEENSCLPDVPVDNDNYYVFVFFEVYKDR
jgi:hypothetical protein